MFSFLKFPSTKPNAWFYQSIFGLVTTELYATIATYMANKELARELATGKLQSLQAPSPFDSLSMKLITVLAIFFILLVGVQIYVNLKNFLYAEKKEYSWTMRVMVLVLLLVCIHFVISIINTFLINPV